MSLISPIVYRDTESGKIQADHLHLLLEGRDCWFDLLAQRHCKILECIQTTRARLNFIRNSFHVNYTLIFQIFEN